MYAHFINSLILLSYESAAKKYVYNSAILIKNIYLFFSGTHLSTLDKKPCNSNATMTRCLILFLLASHLSVLSAMTTNNRILLSSLLVGSALGLSVCKYLAVFDFTSPNDLLHIQKVLHFILQFCRWARRKNNLNNI